MRGSSRTFCASTCGHMFEEKREAVMAIEAAVLPFGAIMSVLDRVTDSMQTSREVRKVPTADSCDERNAPHFNLPERRTSTSPAPDKVLLLSHKEFHDNNDQPKKSSGIAKG
jgi:hypothetical protein